MTKKEARGCITRTVFRYTVTPTGEIVGEVVGEVYDKLPTPTQLARMYPNGYIVTREKKLYAVPLARFMEIAEEVTE